MFYTGKILHSVNPFIAIFSRKKLQRSKSRIMNTLYTINMPKGCRYMSDYNQLINGILPINSKFILNKTLTGCGGTSLFLNSSLPVVIISPRIQVLKDKHSQHPDTFLFHIPLCNDRAAAIGQKMSDLGRYLDCHGNNPFGALQTPAKILVTLDSSGKVLDVLRSRGENNSFLFVVDEFQCLVGDAAFKGNTDMNFLARLDKEVRRICYLSATPISDLYLDYIPQFAHIPYYKLEWDPDIIEEPTLKEVQMKKGESAEKLCGQLIQRYRETGYFERKIMQGHIVESHEACIFLNEVKSIKNIILKNHLKPEEVTVLCSESKAADLPKGFTIGGLCTDKVNPVNKPFTFCTKASFEGVDFYSTNASTYIFIDAGKEWQTLDIMLDIPQILGRQRLDINPFKHDATIYYKTKPKVMSEAEFRQKQIEMEQKSRKNLETFNASSADAKDMFIQVYSNMALDKKFVDDYVDVLQENGHTTLGINYLVMVAKWNQWYQRHFYYSNSCQLLTSIQVAVNMRQKSQEVKIFETWYYNAPEKERLAGYADFRHSYPQYDELLLQNPFIDLRYHDWYATLGYEALSGLHFQETDVEKAYSEWCAQAPIKEACRQTFKAGVLYSKQEIKAMLQQIYNDLGLIGKTAKATDLSAYLSVREKQRMNAEGKRVYYLEVWQN